MEKRVLIKVVLPKPDSPDEKVIGPHIESLESYLPTTIMVKWAPRFATILCL